MDRLKTFAKYLVWLILFMLLSNFLIEVGINSTYSSLENRSEIEQVNIYQSEATLVNGRIRGIISNAGDEDISGKYLEFDFYSENDNYLGKTYVEINELEENEVQGFEVMYKLQYTEYYTISIVDEKTEYDSDSIEILDDDLTKIAIVLSTTYVLCSTLAFI